MKLITENIDQELEYITEGANGKKSMYIEGIFMQADTKNRNGRVYPKATMENAVNKYVKEQVERGRAVGELNHPESPTVNLDKVSHLITSLKWEGKNIIGKAKILDTPMGQIAKGLMEGGVKLGVSSRGMGSVTKDRHGTMMVGEDFMLNTVDIVQDPSAHDAFVEGILENIEWVYDSVKDSWIKQELLENAVKEFKKGKINEDALIRDFKNLLFRHDI